MISGEHGKFPDCRARHASTFERILVEQDKQRECDDNAASIHKPVMAGTSLPVDKLFRRGSQDAFLVMTDASGNKAWDKTSAER